MHEQVLVLGMKDYYVFQNCHVHADGETVTARGEAGMKRLPVEQISGLHLLSGYSITDGLVHLATQAEFPLHFYSHGGHYQGTLETRPHAPQAAILVAQLESVRDATRRLDIAREILATQHTSLVELLQRHGVEPTLPLVQGETIELLRLSEARMRKEYYAHLDAALPPFWSILKRERDPPRRPADALMGFANGVLYAKMAGWLHRAGLDPRLGYLHGETRAPNPLALDLTEIAKPHLSESILLQIAASGQERSLIASVGEGVYLSEKGRKSVIEAIETKLRTPIPGSDEIWATDLQTALMQAPLRLHRALVTQTPFRLMRIPCT